jgi:transposase-like protein
MKHRTVLRRPTKDALAFGRGVREGQWQALLYLWRAVDHEGEVLEAVVTAKRDKSAALKFLKRILKKYGRPLKIVTDRLRAYSGAMKEIAPPTGTRWVAASTIGRRIRISRFDDGSGRCSGFEV